jgi:CheY-like chemotaxis protein
MRPRCDVVIDRKKGSGMADSVPNNGQPDLPCGPPGAEAGSAMLLAQLSHEIRAPLTGIRMLMQSVATDQACSRWAEEVEQSVQYLLNLSESYLHMARAETRNETHPSAVPHDAFDLATVVLESINLVKHRAREKHLRLVVDWASVSLRLVGNPLPVKQILINLLTNGIKFTPSGHVHVAARASSSLPGNATLTLFVSDTGPGLAKQATALAFEPFVRLHGADLNHAQGFGLGLAIVKQLAQACGGDVSALNLPQGGLCVSVNLKMPCVKAALPTLEPAAMNRRYWVLDAYEPAAQALSRDLRAMGLNNTQGLSSLDEARRLPSLRPEDVVICDESMGAAAAAWLGDLALSQPGVHVAWVSDGLDPLGLKDMAPFPRLGTPKRLLEHLGLLAADHAKGEATTGERTLLPEVHKGKALLLVDDSRVNQIIVGEYLCSVGFQVLMAENGEEALDILTQQAVDLVLTDLSMPVLDGASMVREIRRRGLRVPVVALTGATEPEMRVSCSQAGMAAFLTKPLVLDQALAQLVAVLDEQTNTNITTS